MYAGRFRSGPRRGYGRPSQGIVAVLDHAAWGCRALLAAFWVGVAVEGAVAVEADEEPGLAAAVLIHSYHQGFAWADCITRGVEGAFRQYDGAIDLRIEYLDARRIRAPSYFEELKHVWRIKYAGVPVKVVICVDDYALDFFLKQGADIFGEAPAVFCSVSGYEPTMRIGRQLTGLVECIDIAATLEVALKLHPRTRQVAVIADMSRTGRALKAEAEESLARYTGELQVTYLEDLTFEELRQKVAALPEDAMVLLLSFTRDRSGRDLAHEANLEGLRARCNVPIYAVWDFALGHGVVGGKLTSGEAEGRMAGELALRVLGGERASSIRLGKSPTLYRFDWTEMQRFGLSEDQLPPGSVIINREFSFYEAFRSLIWTVMGVIVLLALLVVVMLVNMSMRRRTEQALRDSEENLEITLNSIGDGVIAVDAHGVTTRMNPVAETLTGWSRRCAIGRPLSETFRLLDGESRTPIESPADRVLATGEVLMFSDSTVLISRDGKERQIADSGAPIRDRYGAIVGVVIVFRDVSEDYALKAQLQQARKMEAIGELAGGVAHDFNNLLTGILGNAELLAADMEEGSDAHEQARSIVKAADRATDLTHQLLAFSRKGRMRTTDVDMNDVVREAIALLSRTIDPRITLAEDLRADAAVVRADASQLQNAILNLGINARDAMPDGGTLTFASRIVHLEPEYCRLHAEPLEPGPYVELSVSDTGHGMSREVQERIFEPFFTTKEQGKGTGLGLAGVYGCVRSHHGLIHVHSEEGLGSTFRVLLPRTVAHPSPHHTLTLGESPKGQGHVLVIDDEPVIRGLAVRALRRLGYTVSTCADGEEGVAFFREHHTRIDVVLLDLVMPRLSGVDAFRAIQAIDASVPVIIASGFSHHAATDEVMALGASGFLHKPFRIDELGQMVADCLAPST